MDYFAGKQLLILGLARQGRALARFATEAGARVIVSDLRQAEQLQESLAELDGLGITFVLGAHPLTLLDGTDILAVSGGVPLDAPLVAEARTRGITLTNDSLEFMRRVPATVIGITGSAGKTTTTSLTGAMGRASTRRTWVGGNIGRPLITDLADIGADDLVVQELSSFQLEIWDRSPTVAAVLNITPNHLDRHKTMEAYSSAKANILRYQRPGDVAVLAADDAGAQALAPEVTRSGARLRQFSILHRVEDGAFVADGQVWLADGRDGLTAVTPLSDIQLRGRHNWLNVCAAVALADAAGVPPEAMRSAIRSFRSVEHRLEPVATVKGVRYINDSIATAPERALAAIEAFDEPLVLLAGGKDKDMQWDTWAARVTKRVKHVILFGALADMLAAKLAEAGAARVTQVKTLADAVDVAVATAVPGDIVLLAPGGTSYDAFIDFAERGQVFRRIVQDILHHPVEQEASV